jgi:hypothetical protein
MAGEATPHPNVSPLKETRTTNTESTTKSDHPPKHESLITQPSDGHSPMSKEEEIS